MYLSRFEYVKALIRYALSAKYRAFIRKQRLFGELMRTVHKDRTFGFNGRNENFGQRVCEWWNKQYE